MTSLVPSQDSQIRTGRAAPIRIIGLCAALIALAIALHFTPIHAWLADAHQLRRTVRTLGFWKYPVTVLTVAVLVGCGVPRLLFCAAGGMALGFWPGLIVTQIGTLIGYYAAFLFIRWGDHDHVLRRFPKLDRLAALVQEQGVIGVILLRQLPLHGTITNLCLGLSRVKHRDYLIGSAIGLLTEAIPATLIGAGMVKSSFRDTAQFLVIAAVAAALIWIVAAWWFRKVRQTRSGSTLVKEAASAECRRDMIDNSHEEPTTVPMPLLSICVPVYNEQDNIPLLCQAVVEVCDPRQIDFELLLVDDGSKDHSWAEIEKASARDPRVRGLKFKFNCGETAASDAGLRAARGKYVMTMDADLQNDPKDIPAFLAALDAGNTDCVCGTRVATRGKGDSSVKVISSRIANWVRNSLSDENISDAGCTYRCFKRECVGKLKLYRGLHRFIPTLLKMEGFTVTEIPVTNNPRLHGESKYGVWNRLFKSFRDLLAIRWMKSRILGYQIDRDVP